MAETENGLFGNILGWLGGSSGGDKNGVGGTPNWLTALGAGGA